jgi:hypothetical protein
MGWGDFGLKMGKKGFNNDLIKKYLIHHNLKKQNSLN